MDDVKSETALPDTQGDLRVALIATVLNEGAALDEWLAGIDAQIRAPSLVVIVDGGSHDGTYGQLQQWATRRKGNTVVLQAAGSTIAAGRNVALEHVPQDVDIVAVTDAGTLAEAAWLDCLMQPFDDANIDLVAGFWSVRRSSRWERALAAATMPDAEDVRPAAFLPSSRSVAFRRRLLDAGFRYPAWLDYCEDLVFDLSLLRGGARKAVALDARVEFAVRPDVRAFWMQYQRYARGDGKAGLFARRHAIRYVTYAALFTGLLRRKPCELVLLVAAGGLYVRRPLRRVRRHRAGEPPLGMALTSVLTIALVLLGDLAKMVGYPQGLAWRKRTYGELGRRTSWQRITTSGRLHRP